MKEMKNKLRTFKDVKQQGISNYKLLFRILDVHESDNVLCYQNGLTEKLVITEAKKKPSV